MEGRDVFYIALTGLVIGSGYLFFKKMKDEAGKLPDTLRTAVGVPNVNTDLCAAAIKKGGVLAALDAYRYCPGGIYTAAAVATGQLGKK